MSNGRVKVTVGVCGGIAAYKSVELVRLLQDAGYDPHVVMTKAAEEFVRPLTFAAISGHKVITSLWGEDAGAVSEDDESSIEHIYEAQTTKLLIVAPATADMLAKFAHGLADDFLSTMFLATTATVIVAPAMNVNMWEHPATKANVETLRARGVRVIEPGSGYLACGMVGGGRLAEPAAIAAVVAETLAGGAANDYLSLAEKTVAAPTQEADFAGETVLVTERDEVVAELRPARRQRPVAGTLDDVLDALAASGEVTRAAQPKGRWSWRSHGLGLPAGTAQSLLDELRQDRR